MNEFDIVASFLRTWFAADHVPAQPGVIAAGVDAAAMIVIPAVRSRVEWCAHDAYGRACCPLCGRAREDGIHAADCELRPPPGFFRYVP